LLESRIHKNGNKGNTKGLIADGHRAQMQQTTAAVAPATGFFGSLARAFSFLFGTLWQALPLILLTALISVFFMLIVPHHASIIANVEFARRRVGWFYQDFIRPVISRFSTLLNPLICWYNTFVYIANFWIRNVIYDIAILCNLESLLTPVVSLLEPLAVDFVIGQVLNYDYVFTRPLNITSLIQPMKDIFSTAETILCCSCNDLCIIFRWVLSPLQDDNLYCAIQAVLDAAFHIWRPVLNYVIVILYGGPIPRPDFGKLATAWCRFSFCLGNLVGNFVQYLITDIIGLDIVPINQIVCPVITWLCFVGKSFALLLDLAVNFDRVIDYPTDNYLNAEFRKDVKVILNMVAIPTEVVRIEDYYPVYAMDNIGSPVAYDYSTRVLPGELPLPYTAQECACLVTQILTANVTNNALDLCVIWNGATTIVDLTFFLGDTIINIWRFPDWTPRFDFAFSDNFLLPGGPFEIFVEMWRPVSAPIAEGLQYQLAVVGEAFRWISELVRLAFVRKDAFGFFLPDSMFSGPRVRCSRFPVSIVPEAAFSCSLLESTQTFWPALLDKWSASVCAAENDILDSLNIPLDLQVFCILSTQIGELLKASFRFVIGIIYGIAFGDPDGYLGGPGDDLQMDLEIIIRAIGGAVGSVCQSFQAILIFFGLPGAIDPCSCFNTAFTNIIGNIGRLSVSIIVNLGRDFDINQPYFRAGQQQYPGINRTLMSGYDALGRPTGVGPVGDVERLVASVIDFFACYTSVTNLFPSLAAVVEVLEAWFTGFITAAVRFTLATLLSIFQLDGDYFLDFTQGAIRDTFWGKTSRMFSLYAAVFDLIQSAIVWGKFNLPPDIKVVNTVTPDEYPTSLDGSLSEFVSEDLFSPTYDNGFATAASQPTLFQALRFFLAFFLTDSIAGKLVCPFARAARMLISAYILVAQFVMRVMFSFQSVGAIKPLVIDWIFSCNVPLAARGFGYETMKQNAAPGASVLAIAASCADTDGFLVSFNGIFRCPCEWLSRLTEGPLTCLCGSTSRTAQMTGSAGAGIFTSAAELISTTVGVVIKLVRNGLTFEGQYSFSTELVMPVMVSVTRSTFSSTCILTRLFGDECSSNYWWKFCTSLVRIIFSIPFFIASLLDRLMGKVIGVSKNDYKGGQPDFKHTGYNTYSFDSNDPSQCDPNQNNLACGRKRPSNPKKGDPGEEGMFTIVAQLLFPFTQIVIDGLLFINCVIERSLSGTGGFGSFVKGTVGGLVEIAKIIQSVFFSILHFAWQMFEMLAYFLTGHVGWGNIFKLGKLAVRLFTTIVQALGGHPADAHTYYNGGADIESAIDECLEDDVYQDFNKQMVAAENKVPPDFVLRGQLEGARDAWYTDCVGALVGYNVNIDTLKYVRPSLVSRSALDVVREQRGALHAKERLRRRNVAKTLLNINGDDKRVPPINFDREKWVQWATLMAVTDSQEYSDDIEVAMTAMTRRFDQSMCRADNIAYCICPWEPEVASGTALCESGRKMTPEDERELLQRSMLFSFTGTTQCDALVQYMAMDRNWEDASFMERSTLADCLNKRASSVHLAKEMCGNLEKGDICAWPKNIMYQPDKNAAFLAAYQAREMWQVVRRIHAPTEHEKAKAHQRQVVRKLFNDTRIPEETWRDWVPKEEPEEVKRQARFEAAKRKLSSQGARTKRLFVDRQNHNHPPAGFLAEVHRNLTLGEYDEETSEWLRGDRDMPLDILLRTHGPVLYPQVVTRGSPSLMAHPDAAWNSTDWRLGEEDGDPDKVHRLRTGPKEDLDDYVFEHYDPYTLTGYRMPTAAHRRFLRYELKGWFAYSGHSHRNTRNAPRRRSAEENLSTFEERRDARLRRISRLARRAGVVGPIARDVHGIPPELQQLHLDGMKALDYLIYGVSSGAFYDAFMAYDAMDAPTQAADQPSVASFFSNIPSSFVDNWNHINDMISSNDGYAPNTLHQVAWNGTISAIKSARSYWYGEQSDDPESRQNSRRGAKEEGEQNWDEYEPTEEDFEPERDPSKVYFTDILADHWSPPPANRSMGSPEFWNWWDTWGAPPNTTAAGSKKRSSANPVMVRPSWSSLNLRSRVLERAAPDTYLARGALLQKYMGHDTADADMVLCDLHRRHGDSVPLSCAYSAMGHHHQAKFLFTGGCVVISRAISEMIRVLRYCPGRIPPPVLPPTVRRSDPGASTELVVWHQERMAHTTRRESDGGGSVDYGQIFTDLERLAKLFDYLVSKIPVLNLINASGRLRSLVSSSSDWWTNPNLDENAGPVGFAYWLRVIRRCDLPDSIDCSRGVGAVQALKDFLLVLGVVFILLSIFAPWSVGITILLLLAPLAWAAFGIHAWRYSPMCWTKFMIPECVFTEFDAIVTWIFPTCSSGFPTCLTTDGVICPARDQYISVVDCRAVGTNSGFSVLVGAARLVSRTACSKFAAFLESFVFMGPHGFAPQVTRFIRLTCDNYEYATSELECQQNACLIIMSPTALPWIIYGIIGFVIVVFALMVLGAFWRAGKSAVRIGSRGVAIERPETVPGTGGVSEPLGKGDD